MKGLLRWVEAKEWRMVAAALVGCALLIAGFAWLLARDYERQCREKGTYTVCTREQFSHLTKIGDTYHAHYICVEYAEEPCE